MQPSKHCRRKDDSPRSQHSPELFADYPYPIINELTREQHRHEREKESKHHLSSIISLQWYKSNFQQLAGLVHQLHIPNPATSILEESLRHSHLNGRSSKTFLRGLSKETKPTRIRRILPSSKNPSFSMNNDGNHRKESPSNRVKSIVITSHNKISEN